MSHQRNGQSPQLGLYYRVRRDFLERRRENLLQLQQKLLQLELDEEDEEIVTQQQQQQQLEVNEIRKVQMKCSNIQQPKLLPMSLKSPTVDYADRCLDNNNSISINNNDSNGKHFPGQLESDYAVSFRQQPPPPSEATRCVVLHIESTREIYLVPVKHRAELAQLHSQLRRQAESLPHLRLGEPGFVNGAACIAYFPPECGYFRARLLRVLVGNFGLVEFVDFGNRCCLPACLLRRCPALLADVAGQPPRAYRCQLADLCHRQYDKPAAAWLTDQLAEREVLVEFGTKPADEAAWPVRLASHPGLLKSLPVDRPELAEFFSEQHRQLVRSGVQEAVVNSPLNSPNRAYSVQSGLILGRVRYSSAELHRIGANRCAIDLLSKPASLCLTDKHRAALLLADGCSIDRVRVLPLAVFAGQFEALHSRLQYLYTDLGFIALPLAYCQLAAGAYCVVRLEDDQCYRARVLSPAMSGNPNVTVRLIDLGTAVRVPAGQFRLFSMMPAAAAAAPSLTLACVPLFPAGAASRALEMLRSVADQLLPDVQFFAIGDGRTSVNLFN